MTSPIPRPQRHPLVAQLVTLVRHEIAEGTWRDWLPNERTLSESLQVSRNTLRAALSQLQHEGVICRLHGAGNRIMMTPARAGPAAPSREVAILSPAPLERLRPGLILLINHLRELCEGRGLQLHVVHGRQYFRANPGAVLQRLMRQRPHACWVLMLAGRSTQRWFESNAIPCIVAGTVHAGVNLPFCAQDHHRMARDAVKRMVALGHRRIAVLTRRSGLAVDLECETGFIGAAGEYGSRCEATVARHDDTVPGFCRQMRQLLRRSTPPTALLVTNAQYGLTAAGYLQQLGLQVPGDVSLISRTDDEFLDYLVPRPARYGARPREMAGGLIQLVEARLQSATAAPASKPIAPRFIRGASLGRAPR